MKALRHDLVALVCAFVMLGSGLLRTKLIAESLGTEAVGVLGTISTYSAFAGGVAALGLWSPIARWATDGSPQSVASRNIAPWLTLAAGSITLLGSVALHAIGLGPGAIATGYPVSPWLVGIVCATSGIGSLAIVEWRAERKTGLLVAVSTLTAAASLVLAVLAALRVDFSLAVGSLALSMTVPALIWLVARLRIPPGGFQRNLGILIPVMVAAGAGLAIAASRSGADYAVRALIAARDPLENSLLQPYFMYATVLLPQFGSILITSIIAAGGISAENRFIRRPLLLLVSSATAGAAILTLGGDSVVVLLFSQEFLPGLQWLVTGAWIEIGKWIVYALVGVLLAGGRWRLALGASVAGMSARLGSTIWLVDSLGASVVALTVAVDVLTAAVVIAAFTARTWIRHAAVGTAVFAVFFLTIRI